MQNFRALGFRPRTSMPLAAVGFAPDHQPPAAGGLALGHQWLSAALPPNSQNSPPPPLRIFGYERLNVV